LNFGWGFQKGTIVYSKEVDLRERQRIRIRIRIRIGKEGKEGKEGKMKTHTDHLVRHRQQWTHGLLCF